MADAKPGGVPASDAAKKAAEKAARKALFEATRGADIAAAKANKDKNKKQKNKQAGDAPSSTPSSSKVTPAKAEQVGKQGEKAGSKSQKQEESKNRPKQNQKSQDAPEKATPAVVAVTCSNTNVSKAKDPAEEISKGIKNIDLGSESAKAKMKTPATNRGGGKIRETKSQSRVQTLFDHLPKGVEPRQLFEDNRKVGTEGIHPAFVSLGLMYSHGQLHGSNKRVIALVNVVGQFFESYVPPADKDFKYEIAVSLKKNLEFLAKCRPFAVAMNNTVDHINGVLRDIQQSNITSDKDIKRHLKENLQEFREERIDKAKEAIVSKAKSKIVQDDVVLIFGSSELVNAVVVEASNDKSEPKKTFSIIIVDGRPYATERRSKGLDIINHLGTQLKLVKYTSITGLSNVIRGVTKVILGAHALLNNGGVLAHAGTSQIALMASANNIPVIVCCETLKFCDKSPTDSFFLNEIGSGFGLDKKIADILTPECVPYLVTPVIKYDVTPPELVTAVITDVDILPCTSVPVVLRVQENRAIKS